MLKKLRFDSTIGREKTASRRAAHLLLVRFSNDSILNYSTNQALYHLFTQTGRERNRKRERDRDKKMRELLETRRSGGGRERLGAEL